MLTDGQLLTFQWSILPAYSGRNSLILYCLECLVLNSIEFRVQSQASLFGIYSTLSGTGIGFSSSISIFPVSVIPLEPHTN
jgi:hypothetical protein